MLDNSECDKKHFVFKFLMAFSVSQKNFLP